MHTAVKTWFYNGNNNNNEEGGGAYKQKGRCTVVQIVAMEIREITFFSGNNCSFFELGCGFPIWS